MKHAPVLPPELYPNFAVGDYHLVQAHLIAHNVHMREWFMYRAQIGHTVILDNGAFELDEPDTVALFKVARKIHPTYIVVPDVLGDDEATYRNMIEYTDLCKRTAERVMIVPQGASLQSWVECARAMIQYADRNFVGPMVGVPKVLDSYEPSGRLKAVRWLTDAANVAQRCIHLLGIHRSVDQVRAIGEEFPHIAGVDTTLAVAWALADIDAKAYRNSQGNWPPKCGLDAHDFEMTLYDLKEVQWQCLARNIETVNRAI